MEINSPAYDIKKYKTPTGTKLNCKGWIQEAALRMLLNNLDPEVAEKPEELIVYGGRGKAARNFQCLDLIITALKDLNNDETLLIQSGKPVGILQTHPDAPRVLISNSQLVPKWATWEHFDELEKKGLMMYGQMTAGSWIYIGSQGIVQGTYETYAAIAEKHFSQSTVNSPQSTAVSNDSKSDSETQRLEKDLTTTNPVRPGHPGGHKPQTTNSEKPTAVSKNFKSDSDTAQSEKDLTTTNYKLQTTNSEKSTAVSNELNSDSETQRSEKNSKILNLKSKISNSLKGTLNVTAGLGGMGGAQPLAITMNEGVALIAEVEKWRIEKRIETKYLDEMVEDIDEAIDRAVRYKAGGAGKSIGVHCNAVDLLQRLVERNIIPDTLTDQTSAHDPITYWPHQVSYEEAKVLHEKDPDHYLELSYESMYTHVQLMLQLMDKGAITFDYGNNIRARAEEFEKGIESTVHGPRSTAVSDKSGSDSELSRTEKNFTTTNYKLQTTNSDRPTAVSNNSKSDSKTVPSEKNSTTPNPKPLTPNFPPGRCFDFPGFVPAYIRPLFCEGKGPFRWAALSGDPDDIAVTDEVMMQLFPNNTGMIRWIKMAQQKIAFQGLPARICWIGQGEREKAGLAFNELVRSGKVKAPIVIGRDHLDTGSVASPNRETESMLDGSDAVADWPILNALTNTASGASWVSLHHGGGVGMGYSIHAGMVIVCDGTKEADVRLKRVLRNDPGIGVIRHADAGYDTAKDVAKENNLDILNRLD